MKPKFYISALIYCLFSTGLLANGLSVQNKICRNIEECGSDSSKIVWMGHLIEYYNVSKDIKKVDSLYREQLALAKFSNNVILEKTCIRNILNLEIHSFLKIEDYDLNANYLKMTMEYCKTKRYTSELTLALMKYSELLVAKSFIPESLEYAENAIEEAESEDNDTLKILSKLNKAHIFIHNNQYLKAYKILNTALDEANKYDNYILISSVYRKIANLYDFLNNEELSQKNLKLSLDLNQKNNNKEGIIQDMLALSRINEFKVSKIYFEKILALCGNNIRYYKYKVQVYNYFFNYVLLEGNSDSAFSFINKHEDYKHFLVASGDVIYKYKMAYVYYYSKKPDSSLRLFLEIQDEINKNYGTEFKALYNYDISQVYLLKGNSPLETRYLLEAYNLFSQIGRINYSKVIAKRLKELYKESKDYKMSLQYSEIFEQLSDSLNQENKNKELTLLELDSENKKSEYDRFKYEQRQIEKHRIQYAGITLVIIFSFVVLLFFGFFTVNNTVIRTLGFFSVLFLFEFIVIIIDKYVHHYTHDEPIFVWIFKIVLFSVLLPLHHKVEHRIIEYLNSRKLIDVQKPVGIKSKSISFKKKPQK